MPKIVTLCPSASRDQNCHFLTLRAASLCDLLRHFLTLRVTWRGSPTIGEIRLTVEQRGIWHGFFHGEIHANANNGELQTWHEKFQRPR
jgi:hypothetical protein